MKNFRTYQLALQFHREAQKLGIRSYVLRNQFERASLSVVLNLAEEAGREKMKEKRNFYSIALSSLRECQGVLDILGISPLHSLADCLGAHIFRLKENPGGK